MSRFYLDLITPAGREQDDVGIEVPDLDEVFLEACQAVIEISREELAERRDPYAYRFEVFDERRDLVLQVSFTEILRPTMSAPVRPMRSVMDDLRRGISRNHALKAELEAGFQEARQSTNRLLALLGRAPENEPGPGDARD